MSKAPTVLTPADQFQDSKHKWIYRFPIKRVLDSQLGRMEVAIEPIFKKGVIVKLLVWFKQHNIPTYHKTFVIECPQSNALTFTGIRQKHQFQPWYICQCKEHKSVTIIAYVPDFTKSLEICALTTSVSVNWGRLNDHRNRSWS